MKITEFRKLIREEIQKELAEIDSSEYTIINL